MDVLYSLTLSLNMTVSKLVGHETRQEPFEILHKTNFLKNETNVKAIAIMVSQNF